MPYISPLDTYILSGLKDLPEDVLDYLPGEVAEGYCPLCNQEITALYGRNTTPITISIEKYIEGAFLPLCNTCGIKVSTERESGKHNDRLARYLRSSLLDPDCYTHSKKYPTLCYFCKKEVDGGMLMDLCVGATHNGGSIRVCDACAIKYNYTPLHHNYTDNCVKCGKSYPLDEEEYRSRDLYESFGEYLCGECFKRVHRTLEIERGYYVTCVQCGTTRVFDRQRVRSIEDLPSGVQYVCKQCHLSAIWDVLLKVEKYENYYIGVQIDGDSKISCFILKSFFKKDDQPEYEEITGFKDIPTVYEAVSTALDTLETLKCT